MLKISVLPNFSPLLISSFNDLNEDTYLKSPFKFRKRSYSKGEIINGQFIWTSESIDFHQTRKLNSYLGGISRQYPPLPDSIREEVYTQIVMNAYNALPQGNYDIGIHQIRTLANTDNPGIPTPEGIHQDGFDYVTVTCIQTCNLSGGITVLFDAKDHTHITFEGPLHPGMQIIFSDKTFAHYTSNITPKIPGIALRDVFVVTFSRKQIH